MTETDTKANVNIDEAPKMTPPAVPASERATSGVINKDDIPAVDADVKDSEGANVDEQQNGEATKKKVEMEQQQPPKDPREDPIGWINSLIPGAVHKVNYQLLDWMQQLAIDDEDKRQTLPGKNDAVTKNQFLAFLRDGTLLAKLANRLQPGVIPIIHEGEEAKEKTKQIENIDAFINFAKEKAGFSDDQVFSAADLQDRGKAGYQAVFNTIIQMSKKAQSSFEQKGVDFDQLIQSASQITQTNLIQTILNFFRRARPTQTPKKLAKEAEEKEKAEKAAERVVEDKANEEICKKIESTTDAPTAIPVQ